MKNHVPIQNNPLILKVLTCIDAALLFQFIIGGSIDVSMVIAAFKIKSILN